MSNFSKYEIFEAAVKATKDKTLTLKDVEIQLKKLGFSASDKEFSNTTKLAVVDRFKLEKAKKQSDKQVIASLEREVQNLRQQLDKQDKLAELLRQIDAKIDQLPEKIFDLIDQSSESKSHSNTSAESQSNDQLTLLNSLIDNSDQSNVADDNPDDGSEHDFNFYNNNDQ
ncbi:hypothetical protein [Lactobacillus helveticus]|uniref:Uncharacterized protein n=2 Tax=Lactobacillus helveticus TaxID=1587 RepID=A0A9Q5G551_LACHE|nr:hypothetical protein [Lactobacillus helveticus]NRN71855.1 hypothetical protein [Lactobacillus helveticus]NRN93618.1 hypothetical protein [Lactobacillus helveticus]NRO06147.1 hypothetical protein [Lactobacillus helveticus]NRO22296.1 hypothetical protein [Lactobacillus helveticus]NRO26542.1 hypothetical protein [Lactobacillus helveticus]